MINMLSVDVDLNIPITVIIGPTAIGKSALALSLAQQLHAHIISADSFQIFKYMDIGTAKVTKEHQLNIPHYLIDEKEPYETHSVAEFNSRCNHIIETLKKTNTPLIICGGNGFYLRSFLYQYTFPKLNATHRSNYKNISETDKQALWNRLVDIDPNRASVINKNDIFRIVQALDMYDASNIQASKHNVIQHNLRKDVQIFGLTTSKENLYRKIDSRVLEMFKKGLIEEVRQLMNNGLTSTHQSMAAIGYKETIEYLNGKMTKDELKYKIQQGTKIYSKKQLNWFKKFDNVKWLTID